MFLFGLEICFPCVDYKIDFLNFSFSEPLNLMGLLEFLKNWIMFLLVIDMFVWSNCFFVRSCLIFGQRRVLSFYAFYVRLSQSLSSHCFMAVLNALLWVIFCMLFDKTIFIQCSDWIIIRNFGSILLKSFPCRVYRAFNWSQFRLASESYNLNDLSFILRPTPFLLICLVKVFRFQKKILLGLIIVNDLLKSPFHKCIMPVEKPLLKPLKLDIFLARLLYLVLFFTSSL